MMANVIFAQEKNCVLMRGALGRMLEADATPSFRKNKLRGINASAMMEEWYGVVA